MNLIIDIGNSLAKVAVYQNNVLTEKWTVSTEALSEKISEVFSNYQNIRNVIVSNVSKTSFSWPENAIRDVKLLELSPATKLPFNNMYGTPATLGNDRKALAAAAAKQYSSQNVLVIDAGSCVTYDLKTSKNDYLGGAISPGLKMRFRALNTFTANLPLVEQQQEFHLVGTNTVNSIVTGVQMGFVKEIDGMIDEYKAQHDNLLTIITGGDAQFLSINLKNSIFANSNFLLEGLNYILEFNISQ
ncbi:type III pantothenate kinase [Salinimicrobium soli]|uniref:type III pantothenate kinase n=1 Tax=Salinimicrobium soli TaxID=1254399 RepID=UPI003AAA4A22